MSHSIKRPGLSLSGGGYRADAFQLGILKQLHEMAVLDKIDVISTISGGSITGAYYCLNKDDFPSFYESMYDKLHHKNIVKRVLLSVKFVQLLLFAALILVPAFYFLFTPDAWLFPILLVIFVFLLLKFQFHIFPVSKRIEKIYDDLFYNGTI
ncbi:MAG: hypothetical protein JWM28_2209 [Chitinophagaceae bacterium]|nr:hypothetical protein [Chitinophagaceae bacterium]